MIPRNGNIREIPEKGADFNIIPAGGGQEGQEEC